MNRLQALFFPETTVHPTIFAELLLVCDSLRFYQLPPQAEAGPATPELSQTGLSTGYNPIDFTEEETTGFTRLIKDLKGHEDEFYGGYLASLSMGRQDQDEASVWALISSMSKGHQKEQAEAAEKEKTWQAMLLLKLAEMLAREEAEIAKGLSAIAKSENDLLAVLKGEDDDAEELDFSLGAIAGINRPAFDFERLTRAWARIFIQDKQAAEAVVLATSRPESPLLLADIYETRTGLPPRQVINLKLPDLSDIDQQELLKMREGIQPALRPLRERLAELMGRQQTGVAITEATLADFKKIESQLNGALSPLTQNSPRQKTLTIYGYEMTGLKELCAVASRSKTAPQSPEEHPGPKFLAVLSPPLTDKD
ncbi:MAG: hypothetical protein OEY01_05910 [Desulfobulbaceae bacterium]|nr:hypothetical protein [Desulfobulbaceae bacterium]HIJ78645.1 hypothetical protein [Deltaproteobacteria bacterium]